MEALFLEHEGYFGALGAFLLSQHISHGEQGFFTDNSSDSGHESPSAAAAAFARRSKTFGA